MIRGFLKTHWLSVAVGNLFALILGAVSAVLGVLIGPSLQLLISGDDKAKSIDFVEMFGPRLGPFIDLVLKNHIENLGDFFAVLPWLLISVACVRAVLGASQWFIWERLGEKFSKLLRRRIVKTYLALSPEALVEKPNLDAHVSSLVSSDIRYVREYIVRFYGGLPRESMQIIFLFVSLFLLSPKLLAMFCFGIAPVLIVVSRLGKSLRKRAKAAMQDYGALNDWLQQRFMGFETIKHFRSEQTEALLMKAKNMGLYRSLMRSETIKAATGPIVEFVAFASTAMVLFVSLRLLQNQEISSSVQLSFFSSIALLSQAAGKLGKYFNSNREASAAMQRIESAMSAFRNQHDAHERKSAATNSKTLECIGLGYTYPHSQLAALKDFSFQFLPGKFYCIAGASGAGKSTLLKLLLGVIRPKTGQILMPTMIEKIGFLPQRPFAIADSVLVNVSYPDDAPDRARAVEALKSVDILTAVEALPEKLETHLGFGGQNMSGGQEQRLHLARIFYHAYKVIFIDEGTSALDPTTEQVTYKILKDLVAKGAFVIMIAHRNSAFQYADEILLMEQGQLVASGTRDTLMQNPAFVKTTQYANQQ